MVQPDHRQFPRRRVQLAAVVAPRAPATAVVDLSEGGAGLEWNLPDHVAVGSIVRLSFLLTAEHSLEIDARVVRIVNGRAGVAFLPNQQDQVRQLLAEARSSE